MAIRKSSNTGIPFGNTANRPASPATGQPYFNGELQRLELYTGATYGWQNVVAETPGVTGYTGTVLETNNTIEIAENIIEQGKKVIIFTNFTETLQLLHNHFGKSSVYLDGSCSKVQRQYAVDQFQENDKIKVFNGSLS